MDPRLLESLKWRSIGPHRGGRVITVAGHPTEKATFYFGACAGGVWKTTNGGSHWRNISDGFFQTSAIGALAIAPSDPNVIYAGTGEVTIRSNVSHGDGVYRSTDGGRTWRNMGLAETRHIGDIIVHPDDANTVYVAAFGDAFSTNPERGVYRSTDGGESWELVLFKSDRAGAVDLAMDLTNPRILFASIYQARRYPHSIESGGEDSGLWRSFDGGESWEEITRNSALPQGVIGKIGIATSPARPGRIWAVVEAEDGATFRSDDYGDTWIRLAEDSALRRRPFYYMHLIADPSDPDTVWNMNLSCWKSIDGGATFSTIDTPHGDNHALWIDPEDSDRMIQGNDGGANVSFDGGRTWSTILNQPTAQFYHVIADDQVPYNVYGSQQDNWAMRLPSISFEGAITWKDYVEPGGGESGHIAVKPTPPYTVYGGGIGTGPGDGRLLAWNPDTRQIRNVTVWPETFGYGAHRQKYRFHWTFPTEVSPHNPEAVYVCSQFVHRSTDEGASWEIISPDLTRNDPTKLEGSGGPITPERGAAEMYCTIFAFKESPHRQGLFWAGSDDGLVHISRDGGANWTNITPPDMPEWGKVSILELSAFDEGTAYLAVIRYMLGDRTPYIFKTSDFGETWESIGSGIPDGEFVRVVREDPNRQGLLYAGTETGLYISFDDGGSWQRFQGNLPVCPIHDIVVKDTDLIAGTHGRSFWILDDLTPLHQMADDIAAESMHLFAPRDTVRFKLYGRMFDRKEPKPATNYQMIGPVTVALDPVKTPMGTYEPAYLDAGANPPDGVIVHYWLAESPSGEVSLTFLDNDGHAIRTVTSAQEQAPRVPAKAGANRFVWDMRYDQAVAWTGGNDGLADNLPPKATPGPYQVQLDVDGTSQTQSFAILPDPRLSVTQADLESQRDLKLAMRNRISEIHEAANSIAAVTSQIDQWLDRAGTSDEVRDAGVALREKMAEIEGVLVQTDPDGRKRGPQPMANRLITMSTMLDEGDYAPTAQMDEAFAVVSEKTGKQLDALQTLINEDLAAFNELVAGSDQPPIG